jgi:putative PIN family toxin of toxin-antitoxin system
MIACEHLLAEVRKALASRYFRDRILNEEREALLAMLRTMAIVLPDPVSPPPVVRDPSDDYLIALARAAGAEAIVTGDRDLLDHASLEPAALNAREACTQLGLTK